MAERLPAYAVGYSVRLKDGTKPSMLVDDVLRVLNGYRYRCTWVDAQGSILFADFREDELERVPTSASADTQRIATDDVVRRHHRPL